MPQSQAAEDAGFSLTSLQRATPARSRRILSCRADIRRTPPSEDDVLGPPAIGNPLAAACDVAGNLFRLTEVGASDRRSNLPLLGLSHRDVRRFERSIYQVLGIVGQRAQAIGSHLTGLSGSRSHGRLGARQAEDPPVRDRDRQ